MYTVHVKNIRLVYVQGVMLSEYNSLCKLIDHRNIINPLGSNHLREILLMNFWKTAVSFSKDITITYTIVLMNFNSKSRMHEYEF